MTTKATLPCGVTVVTEPVEQARSVAIGGWLRCGTRHDPPAQLGMAHFLEHMVFKGSPHHTPEQLARAIEMLGGRCDAYTTHEHTGYTFHVLPERLPRSVGLLAELIVRARLDDSAIETERKVVLEEIAEADDSPPDRVAELAVRQAWGTHPLAYPVLGTKESVADFTAESVRAHRSVWYRAERMLLVATGNVVAEDLEGLAEQAFGMMPTGVLPETEDPPSFHAGQVGLRRDLDQIHLCLLYPGLPAGDRDRHALWLLDGMLGATTSSVLFQEVRENRGLAYHVASSPQSNGDAGLFSIEAMTSPRQVDELLRVIRGSVQAFLAKPPTEDELIWVKEYARSTLVLGCESLTSRLGRTARNWLYDGRSVPIEETRRSLEAVTPEDMARVAERVFGAGQAVLSVVGPITPKREAAWWKAVTA